MVVLWFHAGCAALCRACRAHCWVMLLCVKIKSGLHVSETFSMPLRMVNEQDCLHTALLICI